MDEFSRLGIETRRQTIIKWREFDKIHNDKVKAIQEFQSTNSYGVWRIDAHGHVSVTLHGAPTRQIYLEDKEYDRLQHVPPIKNKEYKCEKDCLDASSALNWISYVNPKHAKRALKKETQYGGGSTFRCVPAKIVAAKYKVEHVSSPAKWYHSKPKFQHKPIYSSASSSGIRGTIQRA